VIEQLRSSLGYGILGLAFIDNLGLDVPLATIAALTEGRLVDCLSWRIRTASGAASGRHTGHGSDHLSSIDLAMSPCATGGGHHARDRRAVLGAVKASSHAPTPHWHPDVSGASDHDRASAQRRSRQLRDGRERPLAAGIRYTSNASCIGLRTCRSR